MSQPPQRGPVSASERIASLDTIRGVAILGILPMNALAFGLSKAGYVNVSADGIGQPFDSVLGVLTMVFIDQKMMALFSLLFGVGVVIFAERAAAKGRRVVWLSLWRFALLAAVGLVHATIWFGDILVIYAVCAPVVLLLRRLPAGVLAGANMTGARLKSTVLTGVDLSTATLAKVSSGGVWDPPSALPQGWSMNNGFLVNPVADLSGARLVNIQLRGADLRSWTLTGALFRGSDLSGADMRGMALNTTGYVDTDLSGAKMAGADLSWNNRSGFSGVSSFRNADLRGTDLSGVDLSYVRINDSNLTDADLSKANLTEGYLNNVNLRRATFEGATVKDIRVVGKTTWASTTCPDGTVTDTGCTF
jgi:uncharacterized protein YjbI with pentapeptide repeats